MWRAVGAGVGSIEHGPFVNKADIAFMKQHGTWYGPTIGAGKYVGEKADQGWYPPQVAAKAREVGPQIQKTFAAAYKAGVKIAFGTDAGVSPHGDNAGEFELMVQAGMPAAQALQSATENAASLQIGRAHV